MGAAYVSVGYKLPARWFIVLGLPSAMRVEISGLDQELTILADSLGSIQKLVACSGRISQGAMGRGIMCFSQPNGCFDKNGDAPQKASPPLRVRFCHGRHHVWDAPDAKYCRNFPVSGLAA